MRNFRYKGITIYEDKPTKDGRKYFFKKYKNNKHYSSERYATPDEVVKAYAIYELKNNTPINKRFDLVADDYFSYISEKRKPSTVNSYKKAYNTHIKPFFGNSYINKINTQDIAKWHKYMLKKCKLSSNGIDSIKNTKLSNEYLNKNYHILKNIFDYGIKNYSLEYNPVSMYGHFESNIEEVNNKKSRNYITFEEYKKFMSVIDEPLWYAYFTFLFYADTRKGESMALHWNEIDFENNKIVITNTLQVDIPGGIFETSNKTNTKRTIIMNKKLHNVLYEYKQQMMKYKDFSEKWYVFGGPIPISKTTEDRKKDKYFKLSGVHRITSHQFRHSLTTILIKEYVERQRKNNVKIDKYAFLSSLANRNGHSVEVMMKHYAELFPDTEQSQVIDILDELDAK